MYQHSTAMYSYSYITDCMKDRIEYTKAIKKHIKNRKSALFKEF